jgi:hypothetical protein
MYDMRIMTYEQTYREKVVLHNRSQHPMKLQLFFPKEFKPYLEFNPTLGYIQGGGTFEIWLKCKPDRSILSNCTKFLVHKPDDEGEPVNEHDEYTMMVPIKVTGAN